MTQFVRGHGGSRHFQGIPFRLYLASRVAGDWQLTRRAKSWPSLGRCGGGTGEGGRLGVFQQSWIFLLSGATVAWRLPFFVLFPLFSRTYSLSKELHCFLWDPSQHVRLRLRFSGAGDDGEEGQGATQGFGAAPRGPRCRQGLAVSVLRFGKGIHEF